MKAWHFTGDRLRDGRLIPKIGKVLQHVGYLALCESGLHASLEPFDALTYAPGDKLHLVECGGTLIYGDDKLVCSERTILASMDAEPLLRHFARMQAMSVVHLWDAPDVVIDYLAGDDAARAAAWVAARSAARSAAGYAARSAAGYAARSAARYAARSAASNAARSDFNALVYDAFADWL